MVQLKSKCSFGCSVALFVAMVFVCGASGAPQFIDTYNIQKTANSTYTYQSINGLQRGYDYVYGNTYSSGYKSE